MIFLIGAVAVAAYLAWRAHALTSGGAWTAFGIGTLIAVSLGTGGLLVLALFFLSSTIFGRLSAKHFQGEKERRTAGQVTANGGVAALCAVAVEIFPYELAVLMFIAALAAANSDTWATEGGRRWGGPPFHLKNKARVAAGNSGAITIMGLLFALAGSAVTALIGSFLLLEGEGILAITFAGFIGSFSDTVVGAYVQEERQCPRCYKKTEERLHCGIRTKHLRGVKGIDNNIVNGVCTLAGASAAFCIFYSF